MKRILMSLGLVFAVLCGMAWPMTGAYAAEGEDDICNDSNVNIDLRRAAGCKLDSEGVFGDNKKTAVPIALQLINVVLSFVGLIATGVIVYGGVLYVTSTGDASKTTKAKNCILYGVVGLVVALMSFAIVAFVNTSILQK